MQDFRTSDWSRGTEAPTGPLFSEIERALNDPGGKAVSSADSELA